MPNHDKPTLSLVQSEKCKFEGVGQVLDLGEHEGHFSEIELRRLSATW
jgi:hypothetical protein